MRSSPTVRWKSWDTQKGEYQYLHPNDHVNLSQSTNDVYPTAVNVATIFGTKSLVVAREY